MATEEPTGIADGKELKPKKSKPKEPLKASETCSLGSVLLNICLELEKGKEHLKGRESDQRSNTGNLNVTTKPKRLRFSISKIY